MATKEMKFRPALTAGQINHILELCKLDTQDLPETHNLLAILMPFHFKIKHGCLLPAYTGTKKEAVSVSLGFVEDKPRDMESIRKEAWELYRADPIGCTAEERNNALTYGVDNGLLSEEEEIEYFKSMGM